MFRKPEDKPNARYPINCLIAENGMGDLLCSLVAVDHILHNCPWINLLIWVPDYLKEFAKHVLPKGSTVRNFTEAKKKYDNTKYGITTKWQSQRHTPMRTHPVKYAYHVLADYSPTEQEMSYLKIRPSEIDISHFNLPAKYVVLPGASTELVKAMPVATLNSLSDYILSKGYMPVFLGRTENPTGVEGIAGRAEIQEGYDFSKGINLVNKTTVLESAAIIAGAKLYIGMDGGITHLAGFTDTPIVAGYTFVKPEVMLPVRDGVFGKNVYAIEPDASLGCRGCQTNWTLFMEHDFRDCYYKDYLCQKQITFIKFKKTIEDNNLL